jgi:hypothetical protein
MVSAHLCDVISPWERKSGIIFRQKHRMLYTTNQNDAQLSNQVTRIKI